jgi:hypothetical protein
MYLPARTSSEPASHKINWLKDAAPPGYVTVEVACDCLRACCPSVHSPILGFQLHSLPQPRHRQALADQNILCAEGLSSAPVPHVPDTSAVETF